jgi:hypothetical protein
MIEFNQKPIQLSSSFSCIPSGSMLSFYTPKEFIRFYYYIRHSALLHLLPSLSYFLAYYFSYLRERYTHIHDSRELSVVLAFYRRFNVCRCAGVMGVTIIHKFRLPAREMKLVQFRTECSGGYVRTRMQVHMDSVL